MPAEDTANPHTHTLSPAFPTCKEWVAWSVRPACALEARTDAEQRMLRRVLHSPSVLPLCLFGPKVTQALQGCWYLWMPMRVVPSRNLLRARTHSARRWLPREREKKADAAIRLRDETGVKTCLPEELPKDRR
jgi:hypothetical protein